jgi:hypothetical protein
MPTERLAMRHVRDVIRLKSAGMPSREIARRVGTAPSTVRLTIRRFEASGLSWPLPDEVTDTVLEARLFAKAGSGSRQGQRRLAEPDWAVVHRELKRKHVTLSILWEEYIAGEPGGYRYSRFCELYRAWEGRLSVTMRQSHAAGDKLFVDYAGDGVPVVIDRLTGERRAAQIFVAVLGASSFTYAQATWTALVQARIELHDQRQYRHHRRTVQKSEAEMLDIQNFGCGTLTEIKEVLAGMSLYLGMEVRAGSLRFQAPTPSLNLERTSDSLSLRIPTISPGCTDLISPRIPR